MIEIRPKETTEVQTTSIDKKIEICKRLYESYDPWTFDGTVEDVIKATLDDPFAAIEFLLDTIDSILE